MGFFVRREGDSGTDFSPDGPERGQRIGLREVCALYSLSVLVLMLFAARVQRREFYTGILATEFIFILVPPLLLLAWRRPDVKRFLRLRGSSFLSFFVIFWIMVFAIPAVNMLNAAYLLLIKAIFGQVVVTSVPVANDWRGLLLNVIVVGGSAGICEEILFRGTIMRGFERFGPVKAVFITAALFGMWHMYFQSFLGTFLLGALIGYLVYRSGSLFCGMFAHFTNNALAVCAAYFSSHVLPKMMKSGRNSLDGLGGSLDANTYFNSLLHAGTLEIIGIITTWSFTVIFCGAIATGLLIAFNRLNEGRFRSSLLTGPAPFPAEPAGRDASGAQNRPAARVRISTGDLVRVGEQDRVPDMSGASTPSALRGLWWILPGLALVGFMYWATGLHFLGKENSFADAVLKIFGMR